MSSTNDEWLTEVIDGGLSRREWILIGCLGGAVFICLIVILVLLIIMARRRPRNNRRVRRDSSIAGSSDYGPHEKHLQTISAPTYGHEDFIIDTKENRLRRIPYKKGYDRDTHEFDENIHAWDHKGMYPDKHRKDRHQGDRHRDDRHHGDRHYEDNKHHGERNHRDREYHSNGHVNHVSNDYGLAHYPPQPSGGRYVERRYDDYVPRVHTQYY
ncbi:unnamed protein product [Owenia fusiformis]|uniref:Uncharacterized protein n=1 Tax=Owenia fusiformis TaxID=6347 RepID=A0A8S4P4L6_OWEFU|nr:unnamed protein product [Owenia fusiformis]